VLHPKGVMSIAALATLLLPLPAFAASFDCAKAATAVERLICRTPALSQADEQLAAAYKRAFEQSRDTTPLAQDQSRWLRAVRNPCADTRCLGAAYAARLQVLATWHEAAPDTDAAHGHYVLRRANTVYNPDSKDWDPTQTEDCLSLTPAPGGRTAFSVRLVQTNGHSCDLTGSLTRSGQHYTYVPDPADADFAECRLRLTVKRNTIEIEDPDLGCRQTSCGSRAGYEGTAFLRSQRSTKACGPT
jgi:uncharacterized protein